MNFKDYQDLSADTAVYPGKGTLVGLMYVGLGLGEAGEAQGKIKKILRDDYDARDMEHIGSIATSAVCTTDKREQLKGELGDILWYVAQAATELGLDLSDVAQANIDKLASRKERGVLQGSGDNR
jgi:NTP pyrophosphatase (non-canonical NTP hydrolase)